MKRFLLPFGVFLVLVVFLGLGLSLNPREVPSPLIGKPAPAFSLPRLDRPGEVFSPKDMAGRVWLLNVWASWCGGCRDEHPLLLDLAKRDIVPIYGMDYKDRRLDAMMWLQKLGDPYRLSVTDESGKVGIDYGVYGVPETYLIDRQGLIRFKHIGALDQETLNDTLLPLIARLQQS